MKLKQIMTDDVKMVSADATLKELAREMKDLNFGLLPVCEGDQLIGAITHRDIMARAVAEARDPATTKVRDIMTQNVFYAFEDQDEKDAALLMTEKQIHRLMVFDRQWRLTGIVSLDDLETRKRRGKNKSAAAAPTIRDT